MANEGVVERQRRGGPEQGEGDRVPKAMHGRGGGPGPLGTQRWLSGRDGERDLWWRAAVNGAGARPMREGLGETRI
jgi:hypothetical protein